jgi:hypothetical protein
MILEVLNTKRDQNPSKRWADPWEIMSSSRWDINSPKVTNWATAQNFGYKLHAKY